MDGATTTGTESRLLRELFLQRLPGNVRMILASTADKRLSELAELADSVLAVAPPSVAALQPDIAGRAPTTALHDIREQTSRLADTVAAMQARSTPEERQRTVHKSPTHGSALKVSGHSFQRRTRTLNQRGHILEHRRTAVLAYRLKSPPRTTWSSVTRRLGAR
ncbi:hypothetical protein HPB50_012716 [Hyalomma asiaticum]|uniref:Uncharacterized protein n=1 Tax=Hyalomma asiaticum TaxID=266040 RepID=A0ACB7TDM6_HYAAI|nr:hypothetical protein HPB50_012716 [Hyalomma asiaticum]